MNDRQLRSFVLAAREGSFSKAAARSYISTPAFAQQIGLLEKDVGFALFERTHRGVSLTPAGERFLDATQQILSLYDEAVAQGRALSEAGGKALRIAHPSDILPRSLQLAYQDFATAHPDVRVSFERIPLTDHFEAIRSGNADVTLIGEPRSDVLEPGLRFVPLADETCSFCMRPGHPLARKRLLGAPDLKGCRILVGSYPYLAVGFDDALPEGVEIAELDHVYEMGERARILGSDELLVILARWTSLYEGTFEVVPSSLPIGRIGAVMRNAAGPLAEAFASCLQDRIDEV